MTWILVYKISDFVMEDRILSFREYNLRMSSTNLFSHIQTGLFGRAQMAIKGAVLVDGSVNISTCACFSDDELIHSCIKLSNIL